MSSNEVEAVQADRVQALSELVHGLRDELYAAQSEIDTLRNEIRKMEDALNQERERVAELEARTDLLSVVDSADRATAKQRSTVLIQHLERKAEARPSNEPARATVDRDGAEEALHYPGLERTTYYSDMQRAVRIVDDTDVLWYSDGKLRLDLTAGSLPTNTGGC